jgi:hypothetical protein
VNHNIAMSGFQNFYREVYLKSPHWMKVRSIKLASVGNKCESCGLSGPLDVHHKHYKTIRKEKNRDLLALCRTCHQFEHWRPGSSKKIAKILAPSKKEKVPFKFDKIGTGQLYLTKIQKAERAQQIENQQAYVSLMARGRL